MGSSVKVPFEDKVSAYLELMRIGNPVGTVLTFIPHALGTLFAAYIRGGSSSKINGIEEFTIHLVFANLILLPVSALLHAAGCSWNDLVDAELDSKVARTRSRPIPRGAISRRNAFIFTLLETVGWLWLMRAFILPTVDSVVVILWTMPLITMVAIYPYTKRFMDHPSIFLGFTLSWGIFLGCVAGGVDPLTMMITNGGDDNNDNKNKHLLALACLFSSYTVYVTIIDMVYSHQDIEDDERAGIKSMAVRYRNRPKLALMVLALLQLALLLGAGQLMAFKLSHLTSLGVIVASINGWMIYSIDLAAPGQCWWWFQSGSLMMSVALSAGLWMEFVSWHR